MNYVYMKVKMTKTKNPKILDKDLVLIEEDSNKSDYELDNEED